MAQRLKDLPNNEMEELPNETRITAKTLIFDQCEHLSYTPSSYQLPSKHPNASAITPQQSSLEVQQGKIHQSVRQASFQGTHPSWVSQGQHSPYEGVAEAQGDTLGNVLLLAITDCEMAIVSQSTEKRKQSYCEHCSKTGKTDVNTCEDEEEQNAVCSNHVPSSIVEMEDIISAKQNEEHSKMQLNEEKQLDDPENQYLSIKPSSIAPSLPMIKKRGYLNGPRCERIMERLEILQDKGRFQEHKCSVKCLLKHRMERKSSNVTRDTQCEQLLKKLEFKQNDRKLEDRDVLFHLYSRLCGGEEYADLELSLVIEQGVSFMYQKKFKKSKLFLTSVSAFGEYCKLKNSNILIARTYFLLIELNMHMYKKIKKIQTLFEYLERSEDYLKHHDSPEDMAELYYNRGLLWMIFTCTIPVDEGHAQVRKHARENAIRDFELAIAYSQEDTRSRVREKKLTFCHLGIAAVRLDCTSTNARNEINNIHVTTEDIKDAQNHLDYILHEVGDSLAIGPRMHLYKNRSDQYYREGFYQLAKETAENALQIASIYGFKTEEDTLKERIYFLTNLLVNENSSSVTDEAQIFSSDNDASSEAS